jgi:ubiquinone/menaquinone biosynthesis C-methylase UbiE
MRYESDDNPSLKGLTADYFDRRSETYDQDALYPRLASIVIKQSRLAPGLTVLDIGTGTGRIALGAGKIIGDTGAVVAIDLSPDMLTRAHFKAGMQNLTNIQFMHGDVEIIEFADASFDRVLCSSAFVLLSDPSKALTIWNRWLKPDGIVVFDAPGEPFGINGLISDTASNHGIDLPYARTANTTEKCAELLAASGFEVVEVRQELMQDHEMGVDDALAVWDLSIAHPAWHRLAQLSPKQLGIIRLEFEARVRGAAIGGKVVSKIVMNVASGRKV